MPRASTVLTEPLPDLHCACANLRRAARLVTQLYSDEMGSTMEPSQFSLLMALSYSPGTSQVALGGALGLDKTTTSRNLRLLEKNGWIEPASADNRRERGYRLTPGGEKIFAATKPGWLRAQAKLKVFFQPTEWENVVAVVSQVTEAARGARRLTARECS